MKYSTHADWCAHLFAACSLDKAHYACMSNEQCVAGKVVQPVCDGLEKIGGGGEF